MLPAAPPFPTVSAIGGATSPGGASLTPPGLESGRLCSPKTLGSLTKAGIEELRFAGATWATGQQTGVSLVIYQAHGLTVDLMADAFTNAASTSSAIGQIQTAPLTISGRQGVRITVNNANRPQTIVLWASTRPDTVNAVLAADPDQTRLQQAIDAFAAH